MMQLHGSTEGNLIAAVRSATRFRDHPVHSFQHLKRVVRADADLVRIHGFLHNCAGGPKEPLGILARHSGLAEVEPVNGLGHGSPPVGPAVTAGFHRVGRHSRPYVFAITTEYPRFSITEQSPKISKIIGTTAVGIFVTI